MELKEAITLRHSVRHYESMPIEEEKKNVLKAKIAECNAEGHLHIQIVTNEPLAFKGIASYGKFHGVENYIVMAASRTEDCGEDIGYYGEHLVLLAQTLGLNTCWVGMTYKKTKGAFTLAQGEKVYSVIALGYGTTQGRERKMRPLEQLSNITASSPEWFHRGVTAVAEAPSAINQQKYRFLLTGNVSTEGKPIVCAKRLFSMVGYTKIDLGIAKCHFEVAAGKENFEWEE